MSSAVKVPKYSSVAHAILDFKQIKRCDLKRLKALATTCNKLPELREAT